MAISQFNFLRIQDFTELEINSEYQLSDEMFGFLWLLDHQVVRHIARISISILVFEQNNEFYIFSPISSKWQKPGFRQLTKILEQILGPKSKNWKCAELIWNV